VDFRVTDRGPGVRSDISGRELLPFVTGRPPGEGLGLGLTVAALAIQRAGGELTVQPREGGGTEVFLHFLPAKQSQLPAFEEDPATDAD
jgi:C4-dicarboxylate-specific signal transduction histidine kinase